MILKQYKAILVLSGAILGSLLGNSPALCQNKTASPIEFLGLKAKYSSEEKIVFKIVNHSKEKFQFVQFAADAYIEGRWREWVQDIRVLMTGKGVILGIVPPGKAVQFVWNRKKVPDPTSYTKSRKYRFALFTGRLDKNKDFAFLLSPEFTSIKVAKPAKAKQSKNLTRTLRR